MINHKRRFRSAITALIPTLAALFVMLPDPSLAQTVRTESFRGRDAVAGEIIVRFRDGAQASVRPDDIVSERALMPARATLMQSRSRSVAELMQEYSGRPDVLYAEPNFLWRKNELPNDPFFNSQWALRNTGQTIGGQVGTTGADIGAVQAWDIAQGTKSVVIGVVDSGVDYNHPDIVGNMWSAPTAFTVTVGGQSISCAAGTHGFNAITRSCDPMDDDPDRHGTHVAGIIGADGDNGLGITGVSRVASMMALKFLDSSGSGTTADAIVAIEFAVRVKAFFGGSANIRVLNNSWGSVGFSQALMDAVSLANANSMLFVTSAGNDGTSNDSAPHFPSNFAVANVVSVASTDNRDTLLAFSNFGPSTVHLGAPGHNIGSTRPVMTYVFEGGTSMSAAMVSGAAGLVLSACNVTTEQLKGFLLGTTDPLPSLQGKTTTGGRLNVRRAVATCAGSGSVFTLKSQSPFILPAADGSATATITMNPPAGFTSDVNLIASAPAGIAVSLTSTVVNAASPSTTLTATADPSLAPGTYVIHVSGTSGGLSRTAGLVFILGAPVSEGQIHSATWALDTSQPDRFKTSLPLGLANWYRVVVNSSGTLSVSLHPSSGSGVTLRLLDSSGAILQTASSSSAIQELSRTVATGAYTIVTSTSSVGSYSLAVNSPQLRTIQSNSGRQGSTIQVELFGAQLTPNLVINAGSDIAVSNVVFNNSQLVTATFAISTGAALGQRPITVTTASGTSNSLTFTVLRPLPVIASITPPSVVVGNSVDITIVGDHFFDPTVQITTVSAQATIDNVVVVSPSIITARITVPASSPIQNISVRVTTLGGSASMAFQILPLPPVLTSITPASGGLGTTVNVTLTGANLFGPITISAGAGITVTNVSTQSGFATATARFHIDPMTAMGDRSVTVTTSGGTSGVLIFTVTPGPTPTLTSITPPNGPQTTIRVLDVRGTGFTGGIGFNGGPDITVTSIALVDGTRATVTVQIDGAAALGPRNVSILTPGGVSNSLVFTVLVPPPTLISISPSSGVQESSHTLTLVGTNFSPGMTIQGGTLSFSQISVTSTTSATALLVIAPSTPTGAKNVTVQTPSGTSGPQGFTVLPGIPTLTEIQPTIGIRGRDNNVTLRGINFATESSTITAIPGVTIISSAVTGSSIFATFRISETAPIGPHSITVTTPGGTTSAVTYSIFDPFPDVVASSNTNQLWPGVTAEYSIGLSNQGTATAPSPIVITDLLPPQLTYISGGGNGFSCSAAGQLVTCTLSRTFGIFDLTFFNVKVAVSPTAPTNMSHTVSVSTEGDMNPSNNTKVEPITLQPAPAPVFTFTPLTLTAAQQARVGLSLRSTVPQDVTGTLNIGFSSNATNPGDDAGIQFATGGRTVSFVIPANTFEARFGNAATAGPVFYQTGTVAGSITFNGTARIGTATQPFFSSPGPNALTIAPAAPVLQNIRKDSQNALLITSYSTVRSITDVTLQFVTFPPVQPSCGSVSGCTASGSVITLDLKGIFDEWFTASSHGGVSTLRLPLVIQGSVRGSVMVRFRNALGASSEMTVPIP